LLGLVLPVTLVLVDNTAWTYHRLQLSPTLVAGFQRVSACGGMEERGMKVEGRIDGPSTNVDIIEHLQCVYIVNNK